MTARLLVGSLWWLASCGLVGDESPPPTPAPVAQPGAVVSPGGGDPEPGGEAEEGAIRRSDCDQVEPQPLPEGQWVIGSLSCGDVVVGHTGGSALGLFDTRFYEHHQCTPATTLHDGPHEAIYRLEVPGGDRTVNLTLETPCADLDLAAFTWRGEEPPTSASMVGRCEMDAKRGNRTDKVRLSSQKPTTWIVVVEGKEDEVGAFSLSVACRDGL